VDFFATCGFCFQLEVTKKLVPHVLGGSFHDLWNLLQKIMRKRVCSTSGLWIFPQPLDFPAGNLKITWTDKDLKEKKNKKKREGGKWLEESID